MFPNCCIRHSARRGITLIELLLVMALLVAVAGMALPSLKSPMDNLRLRKAADIVRTEWVRARVRAMESGRTYTFRYEITANHYVIEVWTAGDDYLENSDLTRVGTTGMTSATGAAGTAVAAAANAQGGATVVPPRTEELPKDVIFVGSEATEDMRGNLLAESYQSQPQFQNEIDITLQGELSSPIFFYPDGTTSTARLVLANQRQRQITLTIRGITGIVEVSDMVASEAMP